MQATVLQTGVRATMFLDRHHLAVDKKVEGSEERRNHYCCSTHGGLSLSPSPEYGHRHAPRDLQRLCLGKCTDDFICLALRR
jgi:hypothetical protein